MWEWQTKLLALTLKNNTRLCWKRTQFSTRLLSERRFSVHTPPNVYFIASLFYCIYLSYLVFLSYLLETRLFVVILLLFTCLNNVWTSSSWCGIKIGIANCEIFQFLVITTLFIKKQRFKNNENIQLSLSWCFGLGKKKTDLVAKKHETVFGLQNLRCSSLSD